MAGHTVIYAPSDDPEAGVFSVESVRRVVEREGVLDGIDLAISVIAPRFIIRFFRSVVIDGLLVKKWSDEPFGTVQAEIGRSLQNSLLSEGMRRVEPEVARALVPDMETGLCERGEATVADCLFYG